MVTLQVGCEVSKDGQQKFLIMSGFVSSAAQWDEFDDAWRKRLERDGLTHFHAVDFAHSINEFKGWKNDENRRRELMASLLEIIGASANHKFGCVVEISAFLSLSKDSREHLGGTPISAAGTFVSARACTWARQNKYRSLPIFVFEEGDEDRGSLIKAIKHMAGSEPVFRPKKDNLERGVLAFTPCQAADLLSYEIQKLTPLIQEQQGDSRFRFPFQELDKIAGEPRVLDLRAAPQADWMIEVDRYFEHNPLD